MSRRVRRSETVIHDGRRSTPLAVVALNDAILLRVLEEHASS